jgi:hypothetical protein
MGAAEHVDRSNAAESKTLELYIFAVVVRDDTDQYTSLNGMRVLEDKDTAQDSRKRAPG